MLNFVGFDFFCISWCKHITLHLRKMRERGTIDRIIHKYEPFPQHCPSLSGQPIGLKAVVL